MTTQPQAPFAGANALIYGAAKGIGRAVALEAPGGIVRVLAVAW